MAIGPWHNRPKGTQKNARIAAHASIRVDTYHAVLYGKRTCNASLNAQWVLAVAAGYGKADRSFRLDLDPRMDGDTLECPHHVRFARIGESTVIFTKMTPETPLFPDLNRFHTAPLLSRMLDAQNAQFFIGKPYAAQHQPVSAKRFD